MFLSLVVLLSIGGYATGDDGPVVEMHLGKVRGHILTSRSGREYMAFSGVPYAKPPVGDLRFQPPQPPALWRGVRDAKDNGHNCIQHKVVFDVEGHEDCLYLDVSTHNIWRSAPVLVLFHGGGFSLGFKTMYKGTYLMDEDIVVVQANYRLGVFGFLTFETEDLAGNQGLKDQWMALRWVKQNIASFGGDPDRVTIAGPSAGGASVHSHIVSPWSRGLFQRAISTSGSMYNPWALSPPGLARENAQELMTLIGCPTEPSEAIPCALEKDAQLIIDQFPKFLNKSSLLQIFSPVLEEPGSGGFLEAPIDKWEYYPVPLMVILSSAEGVLTALDLMEQFSENMLYILPVVLTYGASASKPDEVTRKLKDYYFPGRTAITKEDFANLTHMYSDISFNHGVLKAAHNHKGHVYFLWFDYVDPDSPEYPLKMGASHSAECPYMWEMNLPGLKNEPFKTEKSLQISKTFVKSVVQFMEDGEAIVPGSDLPWKTWRAEDQNYVHLDSSGGFSIKRDLYREKYLFWESLGYQDKSYSKL